MSGKFNPYVYICSNVLDVLQPLFEVFWTWCLVKINKKWNAIFEATVLP